MRSRSSSSQARSALLPRGQAAVLALVFLAGNVGAFVHAATERHARCPEHGELIHVTDRAQDAAAGASMAARAAADSDPEATLAASPDAADHDHDHCYLCPVSRKRVCFDPGPIVAAPHLALEGWRATNTEARPPGAALYILAPKTSPPV